MNREKYSELIRFCIVGALCTGIDAIIFYTVRLFAPYIVALLCGYLLSLIINYLLTVIWTFKSKPNKHNAIGIFAAHLFNLFVVRMSLMWLFVEVSHLEDKIAYIPTLLISVITNFVIIKFVINRTTK